jgi:hypothetical protein
MPRVNCNENKRKGHRVSSIDCEWYFLLPSVNAGEFFPVRLICGDCNVILTTISTSCRGQI